MAIELLYPINNTVVSLQTEHQKYFLAAEEERANLDPKHIFRPSPMTSGNEESHPLPVTLKWQCTPRPEPEFDVYITVLSENEDFSEPICTVSQGTQIDIYNLKAGTKYYWYVQYNGVRTPVDCFTTANELPRFIKIENVSNVRDFGGYTVPDGKIKQNMIFRGACIDNFDRSGDYISQNGINALLKLGIKTEIDFRSEEDIYGVRKYGTAEAFGIKYYQMPVYAYHGFAEDKWYETEVQFLKTLTDQSKYPIYIHCVSGADRVGTFVFLLGALLGMNEQDLLNQYEITTVSLERCRTRNYRDFKSFMNLVNSYEGHCLQQKVENIFKSFFKLTDEEIQKIRDILIEKE